MVIRRSHLAGLTLEQRVGNIEMFARLLGAGLGLSFVGILSFAFWLGSVSAKVSASTDISTRVYGVVADNKDSLLVRTSVIEHRLGNVETRLDKVEAKLDRVEARLDSIEAKVASMDSKLNNMDSKLNNMDSKLNNMDSKLNKLISGQSRTQ